LKLLSIIVFVIGWLSLLAQPATTIATEQTFSFPLVAPYLATTPDMKVNVAALDGFLDKLSRKRQTAKSDVQFLHHVFTRVHQTYLMRYREHTSFGSIFTDGVYNCLTGTILFSSLFDHFGIAHEIIETNYHIFILAQTSKGTVLIETTDAVNGFITGADKIENRITQYKNNDLQPTDNTLAYYRYSFNLYNSVSQHELVGLLYYNLAVDAFNKQLIADATDYLGRAGERYISPRVEEFSTLLLLAVHESPLEREEKARLKKTLQTIRYKALPAMAGL
jgi:hypothetical protein